MSSPEQTPPAPEPAPDRGVSRRVLIGGGLLVLGAIGGGVAGFVATDPPREVVPDPVPPADVLAAIDRERDLVALYDAAGTDAPLWTHVRAEHLEHIAALEALLPATTSSAPSASGSGSATTPRATGVTAANLVAAERAAADAARTACLAGNGTAAVLLACIAASEASHAAVLA